MTGDELTDVEWMLSALRVLSHQAIDGHPVNVRDLAARFLAFDVAIATTGDLPREWQHRPTRGVQVGDNNVQNNTF